jgi:uncharacterized protein
MRLLPKQNLFFILFKDVSTDLQNIAALLNDFSRNFSDFEGYAKKAKDIEHHADQKTHDIISGLNKTFITPFDREDIYLLAHDLDDIVDLTENVILNFHLYNIQSKIPALEAFAPLIVAAADNMEKMIVCLEKQKYTQELVNAKVYMHELEDKGDDVFDNSIRQLFASGKDPITVIKQKDILERLEKIMDKFQKVSDIIEGIIVKST